MKNTTVFYPTLLFFICLFSLSLLAPQSIFALDEVCAKVKIEIHQEVTFERQAFDAHMQITNGLTTIALESVHVDVLFSNEDGEPVRASSNPGDADALFFIRISSMEGIEDVSGNGTVNASTVADIHWLIIPAAASVQDAPTGKLYYVGARLTYDLGGEEHITEVTPDYITVRPMPLMRLDYFLPDEVYGDDPFTTETEPSVPFSLGVRIANKGEGPAANFKINSAQPKIVENQQGLLVDFVIEKSEVDGITTPDTLLLEFGDILPASAKIGRWIMSCSLSGRFTEFTAEYSHDDELGGELTSLLEEVNTHILVQDVLVDIPGRDDIRDFLGKDGDTYSVYESDAGITEVADLSATVRQTLLEDLNGQTIYQIEVPPTAGFAFFQFADPQNGSKIISSVLRADGKELKPSNGWLSGKRINADWTYHINIFDSNSNGQYTVTLIDSALAPQPPAFEDQVDPVSKEGEEIVFLIQLENPSAAQAYLQIRSFANMSLALSAAASISGNVNVTISVDRLPVGAEFIDLGNGQAILRWLPEEGQSGDYPFTFIATDGDLSTKIRYHITITDKNNTPNAQFSVSPTSGDMPLTVQFTDASESLDGISGWLWDFGDGTMSLEQNPRHIYALPGQFYPTLTVTEIDGDEDTFSPVEPITVEENEVFHIEFDTIVVNRQWSTINFKKPFTDPVVVASTYEATGKAPVYVRTRNVSPTGFEIRLDESPFADEAQSPEEIAFVVLEKGSHLLEDGSRVVAGSSVARIGAGVTKNLFPSTFSTIPIVTATIASDHHLFPANIVLHKITRKGFRLRLQPEEAVKRSHGKELVHYIAWQPSNGLTEDKQFEAELTFDVNHNWQQQLFNEHFSIPPILIASRQTFQGHDPATTICRNVTPSSFDLRIAEDTSADAEMAHLPETVGYIAVSLFDPTLDSDGDGISNGDERNTYGTHPGKADTDDDGISDAEELSYWTDSWDEDPDNDGLSNVTDPDADGDGFRDGLEVKHGFSPSDPDDFPREPIMEAGTLQADHEWQIVQLEKAYLDPVIVATITASEEREPARARISQISSTQFSIRIDGMIDTDGNHPLKEVSYVVMERAQYPTPDGEFIIADRLTASSTETIVHQTFPANTATAPIVFLSLNSANNETPVILTLTGRSNEGFDCVLQSATPAAAAFERERIDYIAWPIATGWTGDYLFEADTLPEIDNRWASVPFIQQFNTAPFALTALQSHNNKLARSVLSQNITPFSLEIRLAQGYIQTPLTMPPSEDVGYLALSKLTAAMDSDGDGINDYDERYLYKTHPGKTDSDGDGINDGEELSFWGASWNIDFDGDGLNNLLDRDSDGDGFGDGLEKLHSFLADDPEDFPDEPIMEIGSVLTDHTWKHISFSTLYLDPVVVATITGASTAQSANVRIKDVNSAGCSMRLEENYHSDRVHPPEKTTYFVVERAAYILRGGERVIADHLTPANNQAISTFRFPEKLSRIPVVVGSITTATDPRPASLGLQTGSKDSLNAIVQLDGRPGLHGNEQIDFLAWEPTTDKNGNRFIQVGFLKNINQSWKKRPFPESFTSPPDLIAARQNKKRITDTSVDCRNVTASDLEVRIAQGPLFTKSLNDRHETIGFIAIEVTDE